MAQDMCLKHFHCKSLFIFANFTPYVLKIDKFGVIVGYSLQLDRRSTNLAHTLSDVVRHSEDLVRAFVQQQMVVEETRPTHLPVEALGLEIRANDKAALVASALRSIVPTAESPMFRHFFSVFCRYSWSQAEGRYGRLAGARPSMKLVRCSAALTAP